ncbi:hypothetical protein BCR35DRAFT_305052 [Leucosporidium creatinivorum]|uniref:Uncharacterized protein n=1 Tax=Leucosporidium creatinivorum TaxID=106004 RepID=A0A1Y2F664_9BASI|nr:hypothetical protein BCR35DRAFT_305052 [Leucosporidium creatinivorum]
MSSAPSSTVASSSSPVDLLDHEGALSDSLYTILRSTFSHYASLTTLPPAPVTKGATETDELDQANEGEECLTRARLNRFAFETNGKEMDDETFVEIYEYFHCVSVPEPTLGEGVRVPALTFKGFTQLYELQTSAEESETWKDLKAWGYNEKLELKKEVEGEGKKEEEVEEEVVEKIGELKIGGDEKEEGEKEEKEEK